MSDDKMREDFEAWIDRDGRFKLAKRETIGAMWQAWQAAQRQGGESVTYWVLYDSESPRKYIKKAPDGCLAFFDNESDAKRMKRRHKGVNYKMVTYYTNPQPQPAVPEGDWIACSNQNPEECDEDYYGLIQAWHKDGYAMLLCGYASFYDPRFTHWKPTGLKRPEPPEDK